jgi:hypothetical protein
MAIIEQHVRPQRLKDNRETYRRYWWRFAERRVALYNALVGLKRVIVISEITPHLAFCFVPNGYVYAHTLKVFAFDKASFFAVLQSRVHEIWVRVLGSTFEDRIIYAPTDVFQNLPFPDLTEARNDLERIGEIYHEHRSALMVARTEGMTKAYNRFHSPRQNSHDVLRFRELHTEMDRAVLRAYGWDDLADRAEPQFLDETNEDDHKYQGRLFWPAEFREEVLARLLALNAERAAAERENERLADHRRVKRTRRGLTEAELLESVAADEDD